MPGQLEALLGASRAICLDWKDTAGTGGTGGSYNFSNLKWPGSCPCSPQKPVASLLELEETKWSAAGCVEAAAGWELAFLTLSGVQGGPHCITLGASAPGFAASWAPGGGTLPVFQQIINHFVLLGLPLADLDPQGCPSSLPVQTLKTSLLLHDAHVFCFGSPLGVGDPTFPNERLASSSGEELTSLIPTLSICPILQQ